MVRKIFPGVTFCQGSDKRRIAPHQAVCNPVTQRIAECRPVAPGGENAMHFGIEDDDVGQVSVRPGIDVPTGQCHHRYDGNVFARCSAEELCQPARFVSCLIHRFAGYMVREAEGFTVVLHGRALLSLSGFLRDLVSIM